MQIRNTNEVDPRLAGVLDKRELKRLPRSCSNSLDPVAPARLY